MSKLRKNAFQLKKAVLSYLCICLGFLLYSNLKLAVSRPYNKHDVDYHSSVDWEQLAEQFEDMDGMPDNHYVVDATYQKVAIDTLGFDCTKIISGDGYEIRKADVYQEKHTLRDELAEASTLNQSLQNCARFKTQAGYVLNPLFQEELDFPLAFSILLYKDVDQVESLLRAIYRPHNYYCLHVDKKANQTVKDLTAKLAACFDNVFIASKAIDVYWGWFSVVEPDLVCMEDLWTKSKKWKYFINLTGQEYPLKTNLELVRILKAYDGANMINAGDMKKQPGVIKMRLRYSYLLDKSGKPKRRSRKHKFAHSIQWAKGAVHVAATRQFVDYLLHSQVGKDLIEWTKDTAHASEHLFNPLQLSSNLGVPGSYTGKKSQTSDMTHIRYKLWDSDKSGVCAGKYHRNICITGTGDIQTVVKSDTIFVNKFHADYHPLGRRCLEYWHYNKVNRDIQAGGQNFLDMHRYNSTDLVKNHVTVSKNWHVE